MTGKQVFRQVRAELARAGQNPSRLLPDTFIELLNRGMQVLNDEATVYGYRDLQFTLTTTTGDKARLRVLGVGTEIQLLNIRQAWYADSNGEPVEIRVENSPQIPTVTKTGAPEHIWIEADDLGDGVAPLSRQVVRVWPVPNASYVIHLNAKAVVPDYDIWTAELPLQLRAHKVMVDDVLARLFAGRDFHDNAMKSYYILKRDAAVAKLQRQDKILQIEPAASPWDEDDYRQEE